MKTKFVNTPTKKQAEEICNLMHKKEWKWRTGDIATDFKSNSYDHFWDNNKENTCIRLKDEFRYGSKVYYLSRPNEYEGLTYKEAIKFLTDNPMKKFTTPEEIRAELNRFGYEAHGKKCMVSIKGKETEAIIHCKDVPKNALMRWYFCQDVIKGYGSCSGDQHGKKGSWSFADEDNTDEFDWFYWLEDDKPIKKPKSELKVIQEKKVSYTDDEKTIYTETEIEMDGFRRTPEKWNEQSNRINRCIARHKKLNF